VTTIHFTALPLATLTLTAHTRPVPPPAGRATDRRSPRTELDGGDREARPDR
jgi:hypothetical protein